MPLSWNEIKDRALTFSKEWAKDSCEDAEAKSFWDDFFNIFGISRRRIASFEVAVKKSTGKSGYIDLLWKGVLLVEHKSRGRNLDQAYQQAIDYFPGLKERDLPRYILVSDFARFRLKDLDEDIINEFAIQDLHKHIHLFGFIAGYQSRSFGEEDPVNINASVKLGKLHDLLKESGYLGHPLETLLIRTLFCLFADDSGIFERHQFREYLEQRTSEDGSDLGSHLAQLFQVLDTPFDKRQITLDEMIATLPYVNGQLFAEILPIASFNKLMRDTLLDCCAIDWSRISPAIFGSLFQSIMSRQSRRVLGAHYTTETNILKVLKPLFLDALDSEFHAARNDLRQLTQFHNKLSSIRILDPACGCGNFLVVAYRELRIIEIRVLREIYRRSPSGFLNIKDILKVDVDQFYGFEIEDFPSQIAQVALWLMDHQMNLVVSEEFGQYFARLPLIKSPNIFHGNALKIEWDKIIEPSSLSYIIGNPPFVGSKFMSKDQREDIKTLFSHVKNAGILDYVACWYRKSLNMMIANHKIKASFVSTNSITQGEQVSALWPNLCEDGLKINFAHQTFPWTSDASNKAAVFCVIIGFSLQDDEEKWIFSYDKDYHDSTAIKAKNINPYLIDAPIKFIKNRQSPISNAPIMIFGNMANDGGHFIFDSEKKRKLLEIEPQCKSFIRSLKGSYEFINGKDRWCLWLEGIEPEKIRTMPFIMDLIHKVREYRLSSKRLATRRLAQTPYLFGEIRQPSSGHYLLIPRVSSERRFYIPIGFMSSITISTDANLLVPQASLYHFGVLSSVMHMAWMRGVCGRLKNSYRYSASIVYNNFPWPKLVENKQKSIEFAAQKVLEARKEHAHSSLADLYDPMLMPTNLMKSHKELDKAVDAAYGTQIFATESERISFLFNLHAL